MRKRDTKGTRQSNKQKWALARKIINFSKVNKMGTSKKNKECGIRYFEF